MIVFFCHCLPFLLSELSCGVHAVLAIGEWGEQSAGDVFFEPRLCSGTSKRCTCVGTDIKNCVMPVDADNIVRFNFLACLTSRFARPLLQAYIDACNYFSVDRCVPSSLWVSSAILKLCVLNFHFSFLSAPLGLGV